MKKTRKILLCLAVFVMALVLLCACKNKQNGGDNNGGGTGQDEENIIFSDTVDVSFICPKGVILSLNSAKDGVYNATGKYVEVKEDDMPKTTAEIVFGATSREISAKAQSMLNSKLADKKQELEEENEKTKYLEGFFFYVEGNSLAVVWSDDVVIEKAIEYLISQFMKASTLKLNSGYSHFVSADSLEIMAENEAEAREAEYAKIADTYGADVAEAVRTHLAMFDERYYMWLADLYDPGEYDEDGNPLGGGFYFSNSGRDTPGYGVDLESTAQVLAFLTGSGMLKKEADYMEYFPERMQKEMVAFALNCQSPVDGYFYHPQWGTDVKISRISRDCGWAVRILGYFGTMPYWNTPTGAEGMYGDPPGVEPASALSGKLSGSSVSAVSKVLATAGGKVWRGSAQLKTLEAWEAYLEELTADIRTKSYNIGNTVASQASQITNRENIAKANGEETGYVALFEEYFNKYQLDNGLWEECSASDGTVYYNAINGLMKISGGYNSLGVKINHAEEAIRAAAYMVTHIGISRDGSDWADSKGKSPNGSVDVYNPWVCINNILQNVKEHDGKEAAEHLRETIIKPNALEMIKTTSRKIALFARDDGSYCYNWGPAGSTSQGAPVAVGGVMEGDVNGGNIAFTGTYREMASALGFGSLKPFGYSDFYKFVDRIEELGHVIKDDVTVDLGAGEFNFDEDEVGTNAPSDVTLAMNTGAVEVIRDVREGNKGNILRFTTLSGAGSTTTYKPGSVKNATGASLEWEMCFEDIGEKTGTVFQIRIGDGYMFTVGIDKNGQMTIGDASSTGTGVSTKFDISLDPTEWNKFRVEFYVLDSETRSTAAKIFVNDELRFVSNNYFGKESALTPTMKYTYAKFYGLASYGFTCYFDNISAKPLTAPFSEGEIVNPDRIKDFEGDGLPNGVTTEGGSVELDGDNNVFVLDGSGKNVFVGATVATGSANCYALNTKIKIDATATGDAALLCLSKDGSSKPITAYKVVIYEESGKKLAKLVEFDRSGNIGSEILGLPTGEWLELTIEFYPYFYETDETSIVYLNGEEIGRGKLHYYIGTVAGPYNHLYVETLGNVKISLDDVIPESVAKKFVDSEGNAVDDPEITLPESGLSSDTAAKDDHDGRFDFEGYEDGTPKVPGLKVSLYSDEFENRIIIVTDPTDAANKVIKHTTVKSKTGSSSMFTASKVSPEGANCYVQSFDLYVDAFDGGGIQTSIKGKIEGKEVNMFQTNINISANGGAGTIEIKSKRDSASDLAAGQSSANVVVMEKTKFSGWMNVRFELYTDLGIVQIYINDQLRGETDVVYNARMSANYYRGNIFTVSNTNCTMYYDNVVVEAVEKAYETKTPVSSNTPIGDAVTPDEPGEGGETPPAPDEPEFDGVYGFEQYQTGTSSVDQLTGKFTNGYMMIAEDSRDAAGKVLEYSTKSGANESLTFLPKTSDLAQTFVLSFDMLLLYYAKDATLAQIKMSTSYMFSFSVKNGLISIDDCSSTDGKVVGRKMQTLASGIDAAEWHNYRFEYAIIDGNAYIKLYVDGTLSAVSGNYYDQNNTNHAPAFDYSKVTFTSLSAAEFTVDLDNVTVIQSEEEMEKVDYTHYGHLLGSKFEYTPVTDAYGFENGAVSGGIVGAPKIGDANYVSSSVVTDVKDAANKVLRVNIGASADCKATETYTNTVTPSNLDKSKDEDGNYVQGSGAYVFSYDFRYDGAVPTADTAIADLIFNHSPKISSTYWNFIQLVMTKNGTLKVKMSNNKQDTPNRDFVADGGVINDGEWHNIRVIIEKRGADSVTSVFLDDVCVIYRLNCYYDNDDTEANSYISSVLWRQRKASFDFAVEIDNLYFEYAGDYEVLSGLVR